MCAQGLPKKLIIISETEDEGLVSALEKKGIRSGHFTNGTYAPPAQLIVPTVLAAFQYAVDNEEGKGTPLVVAINSDKSMSKIAEQKRAQGTSPVTEYEDQNQRALKVAVPLARQHPNRKVVVVFYDEETPDKLYSLLNGTGFQMPSIFKFGFGTDPKAGIIIGAENFGVVRAHPLPNDIKPVCDELTRRTGQKGHVQIVDLRNVKGPHGAPYISSENKCLSPLVEANAGYGAAPAATPRKPTPQRKPPRPR